MKAVVKTVAIGHSQLREASSNKDTKSKLVPAAQTARSNATNAH